MIRQVPIRGFDKNFSYFISDDTTKELIIVDPGDSEQLIAEIEFDKAIPKFILLTHSHSDHLEGVFGLVEKYSIPVFVHINGVGKCQQVGIKACEMPNEFVLGELKMEVLFTPGHTDDSVCFYVSELNSVLTGDTMFVGSVGKVRSVEDMRNLYQSISLLRKLPSHTIVYPGHNYGNRPVGRIIIEKQTNLFLKARNFFVFSKLFSV